MSHANRLPVRTWRVELAAHDVPPRWRIEAQAITLPAPDADTASLRLVRWAHSDAGVPPWRPCVRHSLGFVTTESVGSQLVTALPRPTPPSEQLELFDRRAA